MYKINEVTISCAHELDSKKGLFVFVKGYYGIMFHPFENNGLRSSLKATEYHIIVYAFTVKVTLIHILGNTQPAFSHKEEIAYEVYNISYIIKGVIPLSRLIAIILGNIYIHTIIYYNPKDSFFVLFLSV